MPKNFGREPICCAVCLRLALAIGYAPKQGAPVAWLCEDCIAKPDLGRIVYHMTAKTLSHHEAAALAEAGELAGDYLMSIGKTDLASLTTEEWLTFLKTVFEAYAQNMRSRLLDHAAPF